MPHMPQPSRFPPSPLVSSPWPTHQSFSNAAFAADGRPQIVTEAAAGRAMQWLACKAWCTGATSKCGWWRSSRPCSTAWRTGSMLCCMDPRRRSPQRRESRSRSRSPISEAPAPGHRGKGKGKRREKGKGKGGGPPRRSSRDTSTTAVVREVAAAAAEAAARAVQDRL